MSARPKKIPSHAKEDGSSSKKNVNRLCCNCAHSTPVTDKWLSIGKHEPTLAHCEFRRYLVLWKGECEERDMFTGKSRFKPKQ